MQSHLSKVSKAIKKGIPVRAYNWWSITSNREWGHPFDPNTDFGLYFVDLDNDPTLTRQVTQEAARFKKNHLRKRYGFGKGSKICTGNRRIITHRPGFLRPPSVPYTISGKAAPSTSEHPR